MQAIDVSKFRATLTKNIKGISHGFRDPQDDEWISTGNYTLNYLVSGDFHRGIPLTKVTMLAGESGSGKSYLAAGNIVRNAQEKGILCVILDSENALDESWLQALDVDTDPDKLMKFGVTMVDDVASILSKFVEGYINDYGDLPYEERPKVLFVIDSLGMLLTPTDVSQFDKGDMKGDMGRKAKALTALIRRTVNLIASHPIGVVCTNHVYASQDMFSPDPKISGGNMVIFAASIVVAISKLKLKEDSEGRKISTVAGIRAKCKLIKTRYAKPFEEVTIKIPYETGMDPYSGLFDFFVNLGVFKKDGKKYVYTTMAGEEMKYWQREWETTEGLLDVVMNEFEEELEVVDSEVTIEEELEEGEEG